jgi:hypothetical protein
MDYSHFSYITKLNKIKNKHTHTETKKEALNQKCQQEEEETLWTMHTIQERLANR